MTRKAVTCTPAETMSSIMERTTAGKFRHLPVVEENRLIGIVSIGDVVKYRVQKIEFESAALRDYISTAASARPRLRSHRELRARKRHHSFHVDTRRSFRLCKILSPH